MVGWWMLACEEMILDVWTAMLYRDDPTVRVRTEAEFLLVRATGVCVSQHLNVNLRAARTDRAWHEHKDTRPAETKLQIGPISLHGTWQVEFPER